MRKFFKGLAFGAAATACLIGAGSQSAEAATFNWDSSEWSQGGSTSTGWTAGFLEGFATEGGVTMTVELERVSIDGSNNQTNLVNDDPNVAFLWDNEVEIFDHPVYDGVYTIGSVNDLNPNDTLENFTKVTLEFDRAVQLSQLLFGDVDSSNQQLWQDALFVSAFNGSDSVGVNYSLLGNVQQEEITAFGMEGVQGTFISDNDAGFSSADANVGVDIDGFVDSVQIFYTQGLGQPSAANPHGIWLDDVTFTATEDVPEPASLLGLLAVGALGSKQLLKRKAA